MQALIKISLVVLMLLAATLNFAQDYKNTKYREVEPEKPKYLARKLKAWQNQSRVVGIISGKAPEKFSIEYYSMVTGKAVRTENYSGKFHVYESSWLAPGRYDIIIKSEGFMPQRISNVQLKANTDCLINLFFNKKIYRR